MAYHYGDATAKLQGRMTLNPIHHLDPIGSLMILLVGFGWAKPVPINPLNFNQFRSGLRWVSFAGPLSNLIFGFFSYLLMTIMLSWAAIPVGELALRFMFELTRINILLAIFNLIPVPPLDGSKILMSFLSDQYLNFYRQIERYAPLILIGLIITGVLWRIILPALELVSALFVSLVRILPGIEPVIDLMGRIVY